jgi:hypothetical protein
MNDQWIIVIKVNDEPPLQPIITGVAGPFPDSPTAEKWAHDFDEKCKKEEAHNSAYYTIMPLSDPTWLMAQIARPRFT